MRINSLEFSEKNEATTQRPIIVIELSFDDANTDIHYITSHTVAGLTGNVINEALIDVTSTSQKINPDKALSTIGSISFKCLDIGLTELQKTKLDSGLGLNGKRVRVYVGFSGMNWSDFVLVQTQIISDSISYKEGAYTFKCSDIQRALRKKLFILKSTSLSATVARTDTTIYVENTAGFQTVFQPPLADSVAPGQEVGFVKVTANGETEIIMWTGKTVTTFTGCTRGMFGTPKLDIEKVAGDEGASVEEYVYMSCPALMMAYALLTGSIYGYAGKFLPDHWHLGIASDFIKTSDFVDHVDLWDINDIDGGVQATLKGPSGEDGKKFIEEELFFMIGVFAPVASTGELSLKRLADIGAGSYSDRELNENNIVSYGELVEDLKSVINRIVLQWDYSVKRDIYQRTSVLIDQDSIDKHKVSNTKVLKLKTLYGSDDSLRLINTHFNTLRTRYSAPPFRITVKLTPDQNDLEVGDIVNINLPNQEHINRRYEVQSVTINWVTGHVSVNLFASSSEASALLPDTTTAVDTSFMAVDVDASRHLIPSNSNYAGIISSNGLTRITQDIHLSGYMFMHDEQAVYYCPEPLQIDIGVKVTIDANVQLRVDGYFTNNGVIDGKGRGHAGGKAGATGGVTGGIGFAAMQPSLTMSLRGYHNNPHAKSQRAHRSKAKSASGSLPIPHVRIRNGRLGGLPYSFIGCSASKAGPCWDNENNVVVGEAAGDAGDSGAGLVIISAGFNNGASGYIDLSGTDGLLGSSSIWSGATVWSGSGGGGHNGGLLIISTDSSQFTEFPSPGGTILKQGASPRPSAFNVRSNQKIHAGIAYQSEYYSEALEATNNYQNFAKVIYLDASATVQDNTEEYIGADPTFTLTEYTNTPATPDGDQSTIEVSVTPPGGVDSYSHAEVDYRKQGETGWTSAPPASHESLIQVKSDGSNYEVRVRPVSKAGVAAPTGEVKVIITTNVAGKANAELDVIYPFSSILPIALQGESGTVFSGLDAAFEWDGANNALPYFNYYEVEVLSGSQTLRTEKTVSPFYVYSYQKNIADYLRIEGARTVGSPGVYLAITIKVKVVSKYFNNLSTLYARDPDTFTVSASTVETPDNLQFHQTARDAIDANFAIMATQSDIDNLQDQIDGVIDTWYYAGAPTLTNPPANAWTTDAIKDAHIGDMYIDTDTRLSYRFEKNGSVYSWADITDTAIGAALQAAADAQDTADSKRRVFVTTPVTPYDVGDLWRDGSVVKGANVARTDQEVYNAGDWTIAANHTTLTSQLTDDDNLGGTADWSGINDDDGNKPANGADVTNYNDPRITNNLIDLSGWGVSEPMPPAHWVLNGAAAKNSWEMTTGPYGTDEVTWKCTSTDTDSTAEGGFHGPYTPIDPNRSYRFSVWAKRSSANGQTYLGLYAYGDDVTYMNGSANGNPYFFVGDLPTNNKWYLIVGYLHAHTSTRTTNSLLSGIYDPDTGEKVVSGGTEQDFKLRSGVTHIRHRTYLYYSTEIGSTQNLARPRVDLMNGSEPTIADLLLGGDPTKISNSQLEGDIASAGTTADWSGVNDDNGNKPEDNATNGATWGSNIIGQPSEAAILNSNQQWDDILGSLKPENNATAGATWGSNIGGQPSDSALLNDQQQWADILGSTKPADNADVTDYADPRIDNNLATPYTLIASSGMKVEGAKVTKTGTSGTWDAQVYSQESYTGGVIASWVFEAVSKAVMVGLNTDPELNDHYSSIDYALYCNTSGNLYRYKSGSTDGAIASMSHGDNVAIVYDNVDVIYYHNGAEVYRDLDVGADIKFYLDSSFASENGRISSLQFGPYGSKSWAALTGAGKPADYADVTDYTDPRIDNNNATPYSLISSIGLAVEGGKISKSGGTAGWNAQAYSEQSYTGGAFASWTFHEIGKAVMVGFDTNPSENASFNSIDYCLYANTLGKLYRYKDGVGSGLLGDLSEGDRVSMVYDNVDIIYYHNGTEVHRDLNVGAGIKFYLDSSFNTLGSRIENLQFGPFASRDWASIGGANKPEDNANHTTLTSQLTDDNNLGGTADWSGVSGAGKPQDNATVGATWGSDIGGQPSDNDLLNNRSENGVTVIPRPVGATASGGGSQTGAIVIVLPHGWTNTMMRMVVDVFYYNVDRSFSMILGGYTYAGSSRWINTTAQLIGSTYSDNRVRFGINSAGKCCIVIGEANSAWGYPKVAVRDFQAGFTNYGVNSWKDGWSVIFEDDLSSYTLPDGGSEDHADTLIDARAIKNQGDLATANTADWASQISGTGKPQNNATAGATWGTDISGQPSDIQLLNENTTPADIGFTGDLDADKTDYSDSRVNNDVVFNDSRLRNNLLNVEEWVNGASGNLGEFAVYSNNGAHQNSIVMEVGPYGVETPVWLGETITTTSSWGGGFSHTIRESDSRFHHEKAYRFSVWVKADAVTLSRNFYMGYGSGNVSLLGSGESAVGNPYSFSNNKPPEADKWYLLVAVIRPSTYTGSAVSGLTGWWDKETGAKVKTALEFKSMTTTQTLYFRTAIYNSLAGQQIRFAHPRCDELNGNEPSIIELLGSATVGADWNTGIQNRPSDTELLNSNTTPEDIGFTGDLNANYTTNTNQLIDGAALGMTAIWANVAGTGKPQDNATAGATWGTNIANVPNHLTEAPTDGLNLTAGYLGYYYSGTWRSYMDNQGRFYLNRYAPDNYLMWNGSTLTVRGDIRATSIDASVINSLNLNAINISGGNIVGTSISGNTITGGSIAGTTITGSTVQTSSSGDRVILDSSDNALKAYWSTGSGLRNNVRIGEATDAYSAKWAMSIGNWDYDANGLYVTVIGEDRQGISVHNEDNSNTGIGVAGTGFGVGVYGYSQKGTGVLGDSYTGLAFNSISGGYGNFRGVHVCLIPKSTVTAIGTYADMMGRAAKVVSTLSESNLNYVFEVDTTGVYRDPAVFGIIEDVMPFDFYLQDILFPDTSGNLHGSYSATHDICIVVTSGIARARVTDAGGVIQRGWALTCTVNGDIVLEPTTINGHILGKALAPHSTGVGYIPIKLSWI